MKLIPRFYSGFAILFLAAVIVLPGRAGSRPYRQVKSYSAGTVLYVTVNKLNYRDQPSTNGKLMGQFMLSEKVKVVETGDKVTEIGQHTNRWYLVVSESDPAKKGWVFGAFLTENPVKSADEIREMIDGAYVEFQGANFASVYTLIRVRAGEFEKDTYDDRLGVIERFTGTVHYQSDNLEMITKARHFRPYQAQENRDVDRSYPYDPYGYYEGSQNAYDGPEFSESWQYLKKDESAALPKAYHLYIFECPSMLVLSADRAFSCQKPEGSHYRRSGS